MAGVCQWGLPIASSILHITRPVRGSTQVKRCAIHYTTPDGRIIPFCAYNGGPTYRTEIEKKFSVPLAEWRKRHGEEYT
jgi:uncharacterized radical SAM superfamily Fe-S cluster-containing enzyme